MPHYNFKNITVVPPAKEFIDIILSKTQRKTPTVIHRQYPIQRIRHFYVRKVKTCQQLYRDKLDTIITEFPRIEAVHPFYADLISINYSKDHYKKALGQLNTAKTLIDRIGQEYSKLLKYGDSLYRCKTLKVAALGRMCTLVKHLDKTLVYLEHVRQHLSRLPSINPDERTLILCGFPNVGKSSFMNKITRADVDVQPYPFTTKSIFLGHTDYKYLRWQVIDTPGILDRDLQARNTIEMIAITALAHLQAAVLYIMDLSEQCGYTIKQQVDLFNSIKPLFTNKPFLIVINKVDIRSLKDLNPEERALVDSLTHGGRVSLIEMSALTDDGVMSARSIACDQLLRRRVEEKQQLAGAGTGGGQGAVGDLAGRIYMAQPVPRDDKSRPPVIPDSVLAARKLKQEGKSGTRTRKLARELELEQGEDYTWGLQDHWLLAREEEKADVIPEIWEGHNIIDYVDPELEAMLQKLEDEEDARMRVGFYELEKLEEDPETKQLADQIRHVRALRVLESREKRRPSRPKMPRTAGKMDTGDLETEMDKLGVEIDTEDTVHLKDARSRSQRRGLKRRAVTPDPLRVKSIERAQSGGRSVSGVRDPKMAAKVRRMAHVAQRPANQHTKKGEADRTIPSMKPKHLFSGKRSIGKANHR